ncbi:MAG: hypothetical protein HY904_00940 [Deltaproteobacteria bacterium]|nr:hypothetical protein [Deltaproteobacteria bacterium]
MAADGETAYLACEGDHQTPGTVVRVALSTLAVVSVTPAGVFPDMAGVVP